MTQAFNLAQFANNVNTSGKVSNTGLQNTGVTVTAGTGLSGGGTVALGGSISIANTGVTSLTAGAGISLSASSGAVTVTNTQIPQAGLGGTGTSWHDVSGSRSVNTGYTNTNSYPISVAFSSTFGSSAGVTGVVGGVNVISTYSHANTEGGNITFIVPAGATYQVSAYGSVYSIVWVELY